MTAVLDRPTAGAHRAAAVTRAPRLRPLARARAWTRGHAEQLVLFGLLYGTYVTIGAVLLFHYGSVANDAVSRVDDGANALFSDDPHLAAIGFVWNPLPSLLEMPLLLLKHWWPALLQHGYAANLESAAFMAGAALGIRGILLDRGAGRVVRNGLPLLFALDPYIAIYGANGMSEAFLLFFVVWTIRSVLRYVDTGRGGSALAAGVWLGLGYLARYEAAAAAAGVAALVGVVAWRRAAGPRRERVRSTVIELLLLLTPFGLSFVGWAVVSWVIVGHPFEQFASKYGNTGFIAADHTNIAAATGQGTGSALPYALHEMVALEPLAALALLAALWLALRRRSWLPLVPAAVCLPVVAFALLAFLHGDTYGWLRFYILLVPFAVCTAAVVLPVGALPRDLGPDAAMRVGMVRGGVLLAVVGALGLGCWSGAAVVGDQRLAREEYAQIYLPLHGSDVFRASYAHDAAVARFIDGLHAGPGQILTEARDSTTVRPVSGRQDIYLETTDRTYERTLADPVRFGIRYILVAKPGPYFDSVDAAYPTLWANGAGFGPMIASFPDSDGAFRIYRVTATATPGGVG